MRLNLWHVIIAQTLVIAGLLVWNSSIRRQVREGEVKISELQRELQISHDKETEKVKTATKVTKKPDGTVIEETVKEEKSSKVSDKITDKEKVTDVKVTTKEVINDQSRYSLGVYSDRNRALSATVGAAIGDLPIEAVILGTDNLTQYSVGVQVRW